MEDAINDAAADIRQGKPGDGVAAPIRSGLADVSSAMTPTSSTQNIILLTAAVLGTFLSFFVAPLSPIVYALCVLSVGGFYLRTSSDKHKLGYTIMIVLLGLLTTATDFFRPIKPRGTILLVITLGSLIREYHLRKCKTTETTKTLHDVMIATLLILVIFRIYATTPLSNLGMSGKQVIAVQEQLAKLRKSMIG